MRSLSTILATAGLLFVAPSAAAADGQPERPNFLLVMVDDMGWTDVGCYGSEIETPNIDALARRGLKFSDYHVSVSCSPTRSMLLTGTDNHIAGIGNMGELLTDNQRGKPGYEGHVNDRVVTLAEVLRDAGYHTYMAGKWHLGHEPHVYPHARGFERTLALPFGGASHWADARGLMEVGDPAFYTQDGKKLDRLPADFYSSRSYTDFLIEAVRADRRDGKPFLAYLAFTAPHDPLHVPEPWLSKYRGRYDDGYEVLRARRDEASRRLGLIPADAPPPAPNPMIEPWDSLSPDRRATETRGMEVYAGMIEYLDDQVGRMLDFLRDIGEYENTVVVFCSDNGSNPWSSADYPGNRGSEWLAAFDHSLDGLGHPGSNYAYGIGWAAASSGPLERFKLTVSEGGIRAPLIVTGPGIQEGRMVHAFTYVTDIMPTILDMANVDHPRRYRGRPVERMRGRSMVDLLAGRRSKLYGDDDVIAGELGNGKWVRRGDFKAVFVAPPYGTGAWQLFDLEKDPGETRDLADDRPRLLRELRAAWDAYAEDVGVVLAEK
ncbi:MAG: arylsulfatase [Planctomycetota bacterium]|jgi:arylsulfatase